VQYLFGDTDIAAQRLKVLAEVFAKSTRAFLYDTVIDKPSMVLDLGCGPGHSTHLLADFIQCDSVVGLDNSENLISLARRGEQSKFLSFFTMLHRLHSPRGRAISSIAGFY